MLAAGMGRRMGKYTKEYTKCMVNVGGRSLLERAIEALEYSGINKLVMVIGYEAEALRKFIESKNFNIQIEYIYNYDYATTNNIYSLYLAKEYLKKEDTILLESDLVYDKEIIKNLVKANEPNLAVVAKYEQWMDGTVVTIDKNCNIIDFIDKTHFRYEDADHYYKTVNIYKFSKEFSENQYLPFLEAYLTAYGVNQYYEQVLKILAHIKDSELYAFVLQDENWYEIDDVQDLDIANTIFAQDKDMIRTYEYHFGGFWRYPKLKDFCYLVNPYYPPQKMLSQIKFFFSDLLTQYPSGMRNQRLNASNMFEVDEKYLLVGNGAAELINVIGKYVSGKMVACVPTFNEYVRCFTNCDIQEIQTAKNGYRFDIDEIIKSLIDASALLLINPDNPSGAYINYLDLIKILDMCKEHNILTIIDESFIDFADQEVRYTLVSEDVLEKYPNLVVIKSISKSYGIPGLRLGIMATSNAEILKYMISNLAIWNINSFAEYYLQIQRLYKKSYIESCNKIAEQRRWVYESLSKNNKLIVYSSQANYIMCQIRDEAGITSAQLSLEMMKRYNILIKNLSPKKGFEGKNFIRVAIKNQEDNLLLIKAINEILNERQRG